MEKCTDWRGCCPKFGGKRTKNGTGEARDDWYVVHCMILCDIYKLH